MRPHCIRWNCSDTENAEYSSLEDCQIDVYVDTGDLNGEGHKEECLQCEAIPTIFKIMSGILQQMEGHMKATDFRKAKYALKKSEFYIDFFKGFTIRSKLSRQTWRDIKNNLSESECLMTFDFPMKFQEDKYRGVTTGSSIKNIHKNHK